MSGTRMTTLLIFSFIVFPLIHIFTSFLFLEHNSIMILNGIIELIDMECCIQERQLCLSSFTNYVP